MVGKSGILKTLEAIIALFLTFLILIIFLPPAQVEQTQDIEGFLNILAKDDGFRSCAMSKNSTCLNHSINANLPDNFDFTFNISDRPSTIVGGLPDVEIFSESVYLAGNVTSQSTAILRVFYWNKRE